jgi:hypothetical protein
MVIKHAVVSLRFLCAVNGSCTFHAMQHKVVSMFLVQDAREGVMNCADMPGLKDVFPIVQAGGSDSMNFDNVLELLIMAGRTLPEACLMMMPEVFSPCHSTYAPSKHAFTWDAKGNADSQNAGG